MIIITYDVVYLFILNNIKILFNYLLLNKILNIILIITK